MMEIKRIILIGLVLLACCISFASAANVSADWYTNENAKWYDVDMNDLCYDWVYAHYYWVNGTATGDWTVSQQYHNGVLTSAEHTGPINYTVDDSKCPLAGDCGNGVNTLYVQLKCGPHNKYRIVGATNRTWAIGPRNPLIADFEGGPREGEVSLYVMLNDTSSGLGTYTTYNWSSSPSAGVVWDNTSSPTPSPVFTIPGAYNITHGVASAYASNITTKEWYIIANESSEIFVTTGFSAMDVPRWVQLSGAVINLLDVENGSWVNTTTAGGYAEITTLSNHTIDAYASMPGYSDGDLLGSPASDTVTYQILMYPDGYANVSAGNVTLYITAHGSDDPWMEGTTVNIMYSWGGESYATYDTTDSHGMVDFVVPNNTVVSIYAWKIGYDELLTTTNTGTGSGGDAAVYEEITLQRSSVTPTPTVTSTTGPGGTTYPTVDTCPCDADHPECCTRKQTEMANILIEYGDMLVMFFIALTVIGGVKMIGK